LDTQKYCERPIFSMGHALRVPLETLLQSHAYIIFILSCPASKATGGQAAASTSPVQAMPVMAVCMYISARTRHSPMHAHSHFHRHAFIHFSLGPCLVLQKFCKNFQIPHHIESLDVCIKY